MKRRWMIVVMILLLMIEGTVMPWIIPGDWKLRIIPHFVFVIVLFYGVYTSRYLALVMGLVFGLLHDVIHYGNMIGVYSFSMGLCGYLIGKVFGDKRLGIGWMMLIVVLGSWLFDSTTYLIYTMFRVNHMSYDWALFYHIIPSVFLQLAFALLVYVPVRRTLDIGFRKHDED
ncbi:rod shape-determining protein MreD [Paenibacillus selenitireducens]|uniref:Rod shape-determining protein MreD n=1 Tax=Paenibacillus selenitireducens TaxID=1324314 RepID=A0A1T2XKF3_9BACL|nr:rod shape-determining protein MreD [Paenibacillus selenitireducens]OPA80347.1 rod shape-determining protein MreD [Paenibacillus selenitireducens]